MTATPLVNIRDVAAAAQVAVSTVSRVLNDSGYASRQTRDRVMEVVAQLGYRPSATARGLRRARTMTLGALVPDLSNPVFASYLRGAEHGAQAHGYALLICDGQGSQELQASHLARLYEHRVDALLLGGPAPRHALEPFRKAGIPMTPQAVRADALEAPATHAAVRHLIASGHRRIAVVVRDERHGRFPARRQALRAAHAEAGLALDPALVVRAATLDECRAAVRRLMALPEPPTAAISAAHVLAAVLLTAIYDAGLRIPHDLAFVTYGDSEWALAHRPPISVIRHDYYAEAKATAELLIAKIERWPDRPPMPAFASEFVLRGSC
jgi:LacI family transcriptional regulator